MADMYVVNYLFTPMIVGEGYVAGSYPLHLTLVENFVTLLPEKTVLRLIEEVLAGAAPVVTWALAHALFGIEGDVPVVTLDRVEGLIDLHTSLVDKLTSHVVFTNSDHLREGYLPHVTMQPSGSLVLGQRVVVDAVYVFKAEAVSGRRTLVHSFKLD